MTELTASATTKVPKSAVTSRALATITVEPTCAATTTWVPLVSDMTTGCLLPREPPVRGGAHGGIYNHSGACVGHRLNGMCVHGGGYNHGETHGGGYNHGADKGKTAALTTYK